MTTIRNDNLIVSIPLLFSTSPSITHLSRRGAFAACDSQSFSVMGTAKGAVYFLKCDRCRPVSRRLAGVGLGKRPKKRVGDFGCCWIWLVVGKYEWNTFELAELMVDWKMWMESHWESINIKHPWMDGFILQRNSQTPSKSLNRYRSGFALKEYHRRHKWAGSASRLKAIDGNMIIHIVG